jgi:hypothetical protein
MSKYARVVALFLLSVLSQKGYADTVHWRNSGIASYTIQVSSANKCVLDPPKQVITVEPDTAPYEFPVNIAENCDLAEIQWTVIQDYKAVPWPFNVTVTYTRRKPREDLPWIGRIDVKPKSQHTEPYRFKFVGYCGDQYFFVPCSGQDTLFPDTQRPFQGLVNVFPTAITQYGREFLPFGR